MSDPACLFCKIVAGDIPADVIHDSERLMAFRDIAPQAPLHVLVIPKEHLASLDATETGHRDLLGELLLIARGIARDEGIAEGGYRCVLNTGDDGGQTVHHLHLHLLGGRALRWPPG
jgi:histidine triad (HIT) family protein